MINLIKTVILHKESKISYIHEALDLLKMIEPDLDFSLNDEIKLLKYIAEKRLDDVKYAEIINDIAVEHEDIIKEIEHINSTVNEEDLESVNHQLKLYKNERKLNEVLQSLKTGINEIELESFASFTEKANHAKLIVSNAFEKLATIDTEKHDNLFIIDPDVDIESQIEEDKEEYQISTGFKSLDEKILGFRSSRLVLFLGGTGQGKSVWLANCTYNLAVNYKSSDYYELFKTDFSGYKPAVLFITNENTINESRKRLLSVITDRPPHDPDFNDKKTQADILKRFAKETGVSIIMHYVPPRSTTAFDIYSLALQLERQRGYKLIGLVVDYLDRLTTLQKSKEERHILGFITDELKAVAVKLNIPVISATQLNREGYKADNPSITNVEESWKKVENADVVLIFSVEQSGENWVYNLVGEKVRYFRPFTDALKFVRRDNSLRIKEQDPNDTINKGNSLGMLPSSNSNLLFDSNKVFNNLL